MELPDLQTRFRFRTVKQRDLGTRPEGNGPATIRELTSLHVCITYTHVYTRVWYKVCTSLKHARSTVLSQLIDLIEYFYSTILIFAVSAIHLSLCIAVATIIIINIIIIVLFVTIIPLNIVIISVVSTLNFPLSLSQNYLRYYYYLSIEFVVAFGRVIYTSCPSSGQRHDCDPQTNRCYLSCLIQHSVLSIF